MKRSNQNIKEENELKEKESEENEAEENEIKEKEAEENEIDEKEIQEKVKLVKEIQEKKTLEKEILEKEIQEKVKLVKEMQEKVNKKRKINFYVIKKNLNESDFEGNENDNNNNSNENESDIVNTGEVGIENNNNNVVTVNNDNKNEEEEWYVDKIGFKPTEDMIEIKMFERFLIEKIFKERQRRRVVVDYSYRRFYRKNEGVRYYYKYRNRNILFI